MIVRELITRLGFTTDQREFNKYDRLLKSLRDGADKAAKKAASTEAQRIQQLARSEAAVARLQATQAKAIQEAQKREAQVEAIRQRNRERAERHARSQERQERTAARAELRHEAQLDGARRRNSDAQRRRDAAQAQMHAVNQQRLLRNLQIRSNAARRSDQMAAASAQRLANAQTRFDTSIQAQRQRNHAQNQRNAVALLAANQRVATATLNAQHRQAMNSARQAAFDQRQAAMRRMELLRESALRQRMRNDRRSTVATSGMGGGGVMGAAAGGAGLGFGLLSAGQRVDEMSTYSTRLNSQFDPSRSTSRDAELQRIAELAGVKASTIGDVAYKTMRSASSIGIQGMTQERALAATEAVGLGAALSGSSAMATDAALIQLFQGVESNRLGGEELRSVMEQTPELARAIMTSGGYKDLGEFRKASKAGEVTGRVVIEALEKALPELRARAGQIPITFSRTFAQLSTRLNYFLLDAQKAANITGKFNEAILNFATSVEKKVREIVANMGGWEIAVEKLVAVIAGVAIPIIARLAGTILMYLGPLALLAAPLTLVFSSLMEFARKYPEEYAKGMEKIKGALGNLVDSVLYAMGARLKPFDASSKKQIGKVSLEDRGNGVVAYKGKEFRSDDAALSQAIFSDNPGMAEQVAKNGGRVRISKGGKLIAELQTLPGGQQAESTWITTLELAAKAMQALADWITTDGKSLLERTVTELTVISGFVRRIMEFAGIQAAGNAKPTAFQTIDSGVRDINSGNFSLGYDKIKDQVWQSTLEYLTGRDEYNPMAAKEVAAMGVGGNTDRISINQLHVEMQVKEAATKEAFIKAAGGATLEGIKQATERRANSAIGVFPIENTSRPTQ